MFGVATRNARERGRTEKIMLDKPNGMCYNLINEREVIQMECERWYELRWGWHYVGSTYVYNEYKVFLTEKDINKYIFDLLHNESIGIDWYKRVYIEDWKRG